MRLRLVDDWLDYLLRSGGRGKSLIVFESENEYYVQFAVEATGRRVHAEIGTFEWGETLGGAIPQSAAGRLIGKGFKPPEGRLVNYWQNFEQPRPRLLAQTTEWTFREVFGESESFTLRVGNFKSDTKNISRKVGATSVLGLARLFRDHTMDDLCQHLQSLGVTAQMAERGEPEEKAVSDHGTSLGVIKIAEGPIRWIDWRTVTIPAREGASYFAYYGVPDSRLSSLVPAKVRIQSVRVRNFPLLGDVVDVRWEGNAPDIVERLSRDSALKHSIMRGHDVTITSNRAHRCWVISPLEWEAPSKSHWESCLAIAELLLETPVGPGGRTEPPSNEDETH